MKKLCKPLSDSKNLKKIISEGLPDDYYLTLAYLWDTQDLTVPWDWRKAHMEEIEARQKKESKYKQS